MILFKIYSWIISLYNQLTIYHAFILITQLLISTLIAFASPLLLRQLFLPSLTEFTVPLHFNFETCRDQLYGVCSYPTAVVDFSMNNLESSLELYYEVSAEIIISESTIISNVGIFQAVFEFVDSEGSKVTFRRSCFPNKPFGIIHRIYKYWWNLTCKTIFYPFYLLGLLSAIDDRKIEISFTDRLAIHSIAQAVQFSIKLENRLIEVESAKLQLRARFGLMRSFIHNYPLSSSVLIAGLTYCICLLAVVFYWMLQTFLGYITLIDSNCNIGTVNSKLTVERNIGESSVENVCSFVTSAKECNLSTAEDKIHKRLRSKQD